MTVGVYGLGRFGALWASILSERHDVRAWNRSTRPVPDGVRLVSEEDLAESDAVFLCVSIRAIPEVCRRLAPHMKPGSTLIDTCSVKVHPIREMMTILPETVHVLGTHPMFGPDSVGGLRSELPVVVSEGRGPQDLVNIWCDEFTELGFSIRRMTADEHDHEAARTQGITHLVGRILNELDLHDSEISTVGYRRIRQVMEQTCNDELDLFLDLWRFNPYADAVLTRFERAVDAVSSQLDRAIRRG
ncbi:MAG: prephenate dehydrogenase/arogenate dehydrogenase family protein [Spirochaetaceae bacterium]|nr:MAG: prephenate dehydrogenase/arogenate dehydrogenase family protein [Spirochaetaceae bacterium]